MKTATTKRTEAGMHNYYWGKIGTLIEGWVTKNDSGYATAWGMLEDRCFKVRGVILSAEIGGKDIDLSSAAERMGCAKELHGMAISLFIKNEGNTDERKSGI
jgi:hypothetical protein